MNTIVQLIFFACIATTAFACERRRCYVCGDFRAQTPATANSCTEDKKYWTRGANCEMCLKFIYGSNVDDQAVTARDCWEEESAYYHITALTENCKVEWSVFESQLKGNPCIGIDCDNTETMVSNYNYVCVCKTPFCNGSSNIRISAGLLASLLALVLFSRL